MKPRFAKGNVIFTDLSTYSSREKKNENRDCWLWEWVHRRLCLCFAEVGTELVLVDKNHALAQAQAEDIFHATPFAAPIPIHAGSYEEIGRGRHRDDRCGC
ncbi:MAG: hypothetical protein IPP67_07250 [Rhodospirillaceae bacterium]|nr:hypothetical protein [Rhodospirillaceae bacterium]